MLQTITTKKVKMAIITIVRSDDKTGQLWFKDGDETWEKKGGSIIWELEDGCGVKSIINIDMATGDDYPASSAIFKTGPKAIGNGKWMGVIKTGAHDYDEYNYFIRWLPKTSGVIQTYDPKISILPTRGISIGKIILLVLSVFGLCSMALLFGKKKKKKGRSKFVQ